MRINKEVRLEILPNGVIQMAEDAIYLKDDGTELTRDRHRQVLESGQIKEATALLDAYHLKIVEAIWTNEVVELYQLKQLEKEEQQTTKESGF